MHFDTVVKLLSKQRLSPNKCYVLLICEKEDQRMTDIAEELEISTAGLTGMVEAMEKDGLVIRTHDTTDRRVVKVFMQQKGRNYLTALREKIEA